MSAIPLTFSAIITILTLLYFYVRNKYNYWKNKNIPYAEPSFILGNYGAFLFQTEYLGQTVQNLCKKFPKEPYFGAYMGIAPVLIVQDLEMLKSIMNKDFYHFSSREIMEYVDKEIYGRGLVMTYGEDWKFTRTNLTPMFSSMKLKNMFPLIEKCSVDFEHYLHTHIKDKPVEARNLMAKFTMFCFVSCAFGVELRDYSKKNEFLVMGDKLWDVNWSRGVSLKLRLLWPSLFYSLGLRYISTDISKFFQRLLTDVFESRNYKPSVRNDFVDALLTLKETNPKIDDNYLIAQCLAIFAGGFETSATTLGFVLFEIAKNKDIQAKAQKEVDDYLKKTNGIITFDCITELPYLDACLDEALRKYPIVGVLKREVTKDFTLPSGVVLEKGLRIHIPMHHLHNNPEYFPEPEVYRPERFHGDAKQEIIPYSYIPFGEGARLCIGKRFAKMQSLSGLICVLKNFNVVLADGMPTELEFEPKSITTQSKCGIHVRLLSRT